MAVDKIYVYQDALRTLQEKQEAVEKYIRVIRLASEALNDWARVNITNAGVDFPAEVVSNNKNINADDWPSGKQLARALLEWHEASIIARNAYEAIPEDRKHGIVQPPR